jgi:hypothetical protein
MDYAALGIEWKIDDEKILTKTGIEPPLLIKAQTLYKYISQLWEKAKT